MLAAGQDTEEARHLPIFQVTGQRRTVILQCAFFVWLFRLRPGPQKAHWEKRKWNG